MKRIRRHILFGVGLVLAGIGLAAAENKQDVTKPQGQWPVFRGNAHQTGVAEGKLPDKLRVRWTFKAKDGVEGTAAIADNVVYVGSFDEHLYAINLRDGKQKWKYKAGPTRAPAAVRDGLVYIGDENGVFHCVDAANGTKKWTFNAQVEVTSGAGFAGDNVLFGTGNEMLYCLGKDGKKKWEFRVEGGPVMGTPTVVEGYTFVAGCDSQLHVINTKTGKEERAVELAGQVGASAAARGGLLYVGTMTNEVQGVDWKKGKVAWTFRPERNQQPFAASVAATDKLVIAGCKNKRVYAINRKTGKEVWTYLTEGRIESSPVVAGERVYVGSLDGNLYVIDLNKGTLVQKVELDGDIVGSPAVADGCLVIGTVKGTVYCLGE